MKKIFLLLIVTISFLSCDFFNVTNPEEFYEYYKRENADLNILSVGGETAHLPTQNSSDFTPSIYLKESGRFHFHIIFYDICKTISYELNSVKKELKNEVWEDWYSGVKIYNGYNIERCRVIFEEKLYPGKNILKMNVKSPSGKTERTYLIEIYCKTGSNY